MKKFLFLLISWQLIQFPISSFTQTSSHQQPKELGQVNWYRDYQQALKLAEQQKKAVLILFQEVPGCATCRNYGHNVLSNPLMVEAIEDQFIPLAIYNNKGGKDREILEKYGEPSWNNPVVRIVNQYGRDLVKRVAGDYSALGLFRAMEKALAQQYQPLPPYMELLGQELAAEQAGSVQEAYFKMYCFWSGEKHFGANEGVLATESGFIGGSEVVKVRFDQRLLSDRELEKYAAQASCSPVRSEGRFRPSSKDVNFYLQKSPYRYLPLSPLQRARINSALGQGKAADQYLSPRQRLWLQEFDREGSQKEILFDQDFSLAWEKKTRVGQP